MTVLTHGDPVVCEEGANLILLVELFFAADHVLHVVQGLNNTGVYM